MSTQSREKEPALNVLGTPLVDCGTDPITGFYRDGCCNTGPLDSGTHTVCAIMTEEFLSFTKSQGNDLSTPLPAYGFPGLKPNDRWCLCVKRWKQAYDAGYAPKVVLEASHAKSLEVVILQHLKELAL